MLIIILLNIQLLTIYDITDPENPAGPKLRIDRGDWANKKTEWDNTAKDLETNKLRDQKIN